MHYRDFGLNLNYPQNSGFQTDAVDMDIVEHRDVDEEMVDVSSLTHQVFAESSEDACFQIDQKIQELTHKFRKLPNLCLELTTIQSEFPMKICLIGAETIQGEIEATAQKINCIEKLCETAESQRQYQRQERRFYESRCIDIIEKVFGESIPGDMQVMMHKTKCFIPDASEKSVQIKLNNPICIKSLLKEGQPEVVAIQKYEFGDKYYLIQSPQSGLQGLLVSYEQPEIAEQKALFIRDVQIRQILRNIPNILQVIQVDVDHEKVIQSSFSEFCVFGSISKQIPEKLQEYTFDKPLVDRFQEAVFCIGALHQQGVVHLDLCPEKLFVTTDIRNNLVVRVGGFQNARGIRLPLPIKELGTYPNNLKNKEFSDAELPRFESGKTGSLLGIGAVFSDSKIGCCVKEKTDSSSCLSISPYTSPERVRDPSIINYESDMWSLGLILLEMIFGKKANSFLDKDLSRDQAYDKIHQLLNTQILKVKENAVIRLCKMLLGEDPEKRPTAAVLLSMAGGQLPELEIVEPLTHIPEEFHVSFLLERFSKRPWKEALSPEEISGYDCTEEEHVKDQELLQRAVEFHNKMFENRINLFQDQKDTGYIVKDDVNSETEIFARADIHGDLGTLIAHLRTCRSQYFCNKNYVFRKNHLELFLGDFLDRGLNEIEVMLLLLCLRMANPDSAILIRGNHDNVENQLRLNMTREKDWLLKNKKIMEICYSTFPVADYVAAKQGRADRQGRREYVQFSHGAKSLQFDPIEFLEKSIVQLEDRFSVLPDGPCGEKRLQAIALQEDATGKALHQQEAAGRVLQAREEEKRLVAEYDPFSKHKDRFAGSDIKDILFDVEWTDKRGFCISPPLLQDISRVGGEKACVKHTVRGHEHEYKEHIVKRKDRVTEKVVATTLAVGIVGGLYRQLPQFKKQIVQGMLYKVAPRVRDWKKTPYCLRGEQKEARLVRGYSKGIFEKVV